MKSKISQATKKSVSLLLAILMMFSMLTVGLTVTVNAATDAKFTAGEKFYYDFSAVNSQGVNTNNNIFNTEWWYSSDSLKALPNGILETTFKTDADLSSTSSTVLFKAQVNNWNEVTAKDFTNPWSSGNNMIVVNSSGTKFAWATYGSTAETTTVEPSETTTAPVTGDSTTTIYVNKDSGYTFLYVWAHDSTGSNKKEPLGDWNNCYNYAKTEKTIGEKTYYVFEFSLGSAYSTFSMIARNSNDKTGDLENFAVGKSYTIDGTVSSASDVNEGAPAGSTDPIEPTTAPTTDPTNPTVSTISFIQSDRIYAYAGTDLTKNQNDAWVAAEKNAEPQDVYNNDGMTSGAKQYPALGSTTETNLRIFLPSSASPTEVVLYNAFSTDIKVGTTTINANSTAKVPYTSGAEMTVTSTAFADKKLTIYKSEAQGSLFLNNTSADYGGYTTINGTEGVPKMIERLYSGKDSGELDKKSGNSGAISTNDGTVTNVTVSKVKGRGNSTWINTDKKSFNVTFKNSPAGIINEKFTGNKYSLLANYKDPSLSRNKILYALGDYMGAKYSPDVATIDLYMNGLYMGNYLMCQKVEVGSGELIGDLDAETLIEEKYGDFATALNSASEIRTNGFSFLMELDTNAGNGDFHFDVNHGGFTQTLTIKEPEYLNDDGSMPQDDLRNAIQSFVTDKYKALIDALNGTGNLSDIIDVDSLARYMMLNELAKNFDIGVSSTYFVYNKGEGKFYISPVWDLDVTTGNCKEENNDYQSYQGDWTDKNSEHNNVMKKVFSNATVKEAVKSFWTPQYYTDLVAKITELTEGAIKDGAGSFENNNRKWTQPYGFQGKYGDDVQQKTNLTLATYDTTTGNYSNNSSTKTYGATPAEQTKFVGDWLKSRAAWLTSQYATGSTDPTEPTPTKQFNSVGLIGTINGSGDWNSESYELTYADGVWSITLEFTGGTNNFKARTNDDWGTNPSFGNGNTSGGEGSDNYTETLTGTYKISIADGAANGTALTIEKVPDEPTEPTDPTDPTGVKDKKIYFDPSGDDAWKGKIKADTIVNVTVKDGSGNPLASFDMAIDTDDIHGLYKGVFRALVDEETLAKLQVPSNKITFALSGDTVTVTADGNSSVTDGWIYTSTTEQDKPSMWAQYNTTYTEAYPHEDITNYQQFENYLQEQKEVNNSHNIVYFDNSVSQWYNVYIYGWGATEMNSDTREMKKLPYADIWYYDFGNTKPTSEFLFKDRSGETFGTDYQETVDLVGKNVDQEGNYVYNGDGEKVLLNFENTIDTPNPIFITSNFYKCTTKGATGIDGGDTNNILKFRAFNTEWQEFATVVKNAVKTTAVDVYFDLHSNTAEDIKLYHESTQYTFPSAFTRLKQLGNSNIYYAKMKLPYTTDANGNINIAFEFTQFIVDNADGTSTTYTMSNYVQPKSDCITTGEVWYEYNTTPSNCGILGYSHSTATFESTTGGSITDAYVELKNGYYQDAAYKTGYATTTDGVTTVIYAIPTAKTGANTDYTSTTSGESGYIFNGWTKDSNVLRNETTITDVVANNTATVSYVANWSEVKEVTYTFVYNYDKFNTIVDGKYSPEYDPNRALISDSYTIQVNVKENATDAEILALFMAHAPKLSNDYFDYTFDRITLESLIISRDQFKVEGKADIFGDAKKYSVTLKDVVSGSSENKGYYFYQHIATLTKEPTTGNTIVWKNYDTGAVLGYGNTYKFRITKDITISYEEIPLETSTDRTVVNAPTYEFYTSGSTQRVRFNFLVENFVSSDATVKEYGVLYFFTDEKGAPVDKTIAQDENISKETLIKAAQGGVDGIKSYNATKIVNSRKRYIYAPTISYTQANTDRYLRVFSYYIKDDNTVVVSDHESVVLGSIREAITIS